MNSKILFASFFFQVCEGYYLVKVIDTDFLSDSQSLYDSASEANTTFFEIYSPPLSVEKMKETDLVHPPSSSVNNVGNDEICSEIGSVDTEVLGQEFLTTYELFCLFDSLSVKRTISQFFTNIGTQLYQQSITLTIFRSILLLR